MKKECILYKPLKGYIVQCTCCNHYCTIKNSQTGKCGIRQNINGKLYLLVHSQSVAINVDPIEKKPLFHFLPGTKIFSFGTVGCNFFCKFCQNWDISQTRLSNTPDIENKGTYLPPENIIKYCKENNIQSIAYTYNEPTIFFEYAYDTMILARKNNIKNVFVSNGFQSKEFWEKASGLIDAINIDLKGFSEEFYKNVCGARLKPILENIEFVAKHTNIWQEITTLIIPGENDKDSDFLEIANFTKNISDEIPWHISAFYPNYKMTQTPVTPFETLKKAYEIGKKVGLKYIYIGNIGDSKTETTYCPKCGEILIKRAGYIGQDVKIFRTIPGVCHKCGEKIYGVW
ncbi:MAG: AmmeMemoRadiSam system radical SAM enzyme [Candidatus Gracilibacteria bacterium]|nr:AmmeMemoRadiSam system radical SAM enzyme [Candidatus Gracilibacteria bacterium]